MLVTVLSSVPSQEVGWDERLRNDIFCVECYVKPQLNQSLQYSVIYRATSICISEFAM